MPFPMRFILVCTLSLLIGCVGPRPGSPAPRTGDEIVVCGRMFHTGAPVVLWTDPGGYDAYRVECRFAPDKTLPAGAGKNATPNRYGSFRRNLPPDVDAEVKRDGWRLDELTKYVDLFVMHYDVCGTSRRCFQVLQDDRGLSVHFMLDVDGTIYQTLDLKERAWHAGSANDRSIGIEIANMGAYADAATLAKWYKPDGGGVVFNPPPTKGATGIRTAGFVARPARPRPITGPIHGKTLVQYDLTNAQYQSLSRLVAAIGRVFPRIRLDAPRGPDGMVRMDLLTADELAHFNGLIGHYHLTKDKTDPGPAFDWDRVIRSAKSAAR